MKHIQPAKSKNYDEFIPNLYKTSSCEVLEIKRTSEDGEESVQSEDKPLNL